MTDLKTKYLGLELKNPLVASASTLSKKFDNIKKMEDAGLSAVVLYSLFEEEIQHESLELNYFLNRGTESFPEALTYFPEVDNFNLSSEKYLDIIRKAKESVEIPIIGSLNGVSNSGWVKHAKLIEEAGADALELNLYFVATDLDINAAEMEKSYLEVVRAIRKEIHIPLAVKLSPFFSSLPNFVKQVEEAGANAVVLFNRFYQPDLDVEDLEIKPWLELSTTRDLLLPLRWTAILYDRVHLDMALTSGVHNGTGMVKAIMAGASVAMTASELIANGIGRAEEMVREFSDWVTWHNYESVDQIRGVLSQKAVAVPAAFERANYMKALSLHDNEV
jgi:dihydroorotate dehydrogenase (fumarate)